MKVYIETSVQTILKVTVHYNAYTNTSLLEEETQSKYITNLVLAENLENLRQIHLVVLGSKCSGAGQSLSWSYKTSTKKHNEPCQRT